MAAPATATVLADIGGEAKIGAGARELAANDSALVSASPRQAVAAVVAAMAPAAAVTVAETRDAGALESVSLLAEARLMLSAQATGLEK